MQQKTVAIIGAGPAGLVAANTLLRHPSKCFKVSVFEAKSRVGGLWAVEPGQEDAILDPNMPTNLSKFTVAFSDLSWSAVDLAQPDSNAGKLPLFPKAWMVGRYLETYAKKHLPPECLHTSSTVTSLSSVDVHGHPKQLVKWRQGTEDATQENIFDKVIISSGFFSQPRPLDKITSAPTILGVPVVHSSRLRRLKDFLPPGSPKSGKILIVGGGFSGAEAAAKVALELSNARHAPDSKSSAFEDCDYSVSHVITKPFYSIPPIIPLEVDPNDRTPKFVPIDPVFYNLSRRSDDPITAQTGAVPAERARKAHEWLQNLLGKNSHDNMQKELGGLDDTEVHRVALCESYYEWVRSGAIKLCPGHVISLQSGPAQSTNGETSSSASHSTTATLKTKEGEKKIDDIIAVIYASGYTSDPALSFLSAPLKEAIDYDASIRRLPVILSDLYTHNPALTDIAFIGFYEGPYWGVMEMQSRLTAQRWASDLSSEANSTAQLEKIKEVRRLIQQSPGSITQFWNGDYTGLMEEGARLTGAKRLDTAFGGPKAGPVLPARYIKADTDPSIPQSIVNELVALTKDPTALVSRAAFRGMHGSWKIRRDLDSKLPEFPSGTFTGTAQFLPRHATAADFDFEYLYTEQGSLTTRTGFTMQGSRRYVYRYSDAKDEISVWFVKEDGITVDYLFHVLKINEEKDKQGWRGVADHLCVQDMYDTEYRWVFSGVGLKGFEVKHGVTGPRKDYVSVTWFERG